MPRSSEHGRRLALCVACVLLCSAGAALVQTAGCRVQVRSITLPTQNGQWLAADLFKPDSATKANPAPLVIVVPGFQRSKETLSNISIELARRGIVVISIDPYAQGGSSASMSRRAATTEGYGMFAVVDYAYDTNNLNYIDKQRIGTTGHSAGGNAAIRGASYFGKQAKQSGQPGKLHSVFVSGYVLTLTDDVLQHVRSNVGMSYAFYDEGAYRNELKNGDMRRAPESLRLVNSAMPTSAGRIEEIEIGRYYGDQYELTLRVVHNERLLHPFQPYSIEATANQLEYFEKVFDVESGLPIHDQIWYWKELLTLLSTLAAFVSIIPLTGLLLQLPWFQSLVHPLPQPLARPRGRGKAIFWGALTVSALIACFTYIPLAELSQRLFVAASTRQQTWFFPQRMNNAVMMWALLNGLIGLLMHWMIYRYHGKRMGASTELWGASTTVGEFVKTLVLACTVFAGFFLLLFVTYYVFHVDYRFVFFGARVFDPVMFLLLLMYVPMFFLLFVSNSLRVNGAMRFADEPEWRSMLRAGVANSLGLFLILVVQYSVFAATGTVYWTDGWLYVNLLFAVVPIMFVLPYFHRYFFRLTGRIYLGPLTMCLIFIMILLSNTVCYTPL